MINPGFTIAHKRKMKFKDLLTIPWHAKAKPKRNKM